MCRGCVCRPAGRQCGGAWTRGGARDDPVLLLPQTGAAHGANLPQEGEGCRRVRGAWDPTFAWTHQVQKHTGPIHTARNKRSNTLSNTRHKQRCIHTWCKFVTLWCHSYGIPGLLHHFDIMWGFHSAIRNRNFLFGNGMNLPDSWDEAEFFDEVSRWPELYDISQDLYSNNEHRLCCFRQIGVTFSVDGKKIYS